MDKLFLILSEFTHLDHLPPTNGLNTTKVAMHKNTGIMRKHRLTCMHIF